MSSFLSDPCRNVIRRTTGARVQKRICEENFHGWKPLPGNDRWRHSRRRSLSVCCTDLYIVKVSDDAIIECNHESYGKVINKSNLQSKNSSTVHAYTDNNNNKARKIERLFSKKQCLKNWFHIQDNVAYFSMSRINIPHHNAPSFPSHSQLFRFPLSGLQFIFLKPS
jgi:hypothetical protein